jgi:hypothetical protein
LLAFILLQKVLTFELIAWFGWNLCGDDDIKDDLESILLNPIASTIKITVVGANFELIGGFGWNFVWRWRLLRLHLLHSI